MAKVFGMVGLRYADDVLLPYSYLDYSTALVQYIQDLDNTAAHTPLNTSSLHQSASIFKQSAQVVAQEIDRAVKVINSSSIFYCNNS